MILLDQNLHEVGNVDVDLDIEIGLSDSPNDFEFNTATIQALNPHAWYIEGTEYGGIVEYDEGSTEVNYKKLQGYTWRGLLALSIISPPAGQDYLIVSGEANNIIRSLVSNVLGGFFSVSTALSGLTITNHQFPLYCTLLDGIEWMLEEHDYRLKINCVKDGATIKVQLEAVPSVQIEGTMNADNRIPMKFIRNNMGINHLICAGEGKLQNRVKLDLYIDGSGQVSETQYYFGFAERTAFYNYGSAESADDLRDSGKERLLSLASSKTLEMKAPQQLGLEIGDKVKGQFPDGTILIKPIVRKIFKIVDGIESVEYKIKGEN